MSQHKGEGVLKRVKRRWSPPPYNILENDAGPYPKNIEEVNLLDNTGYFSIVVYLKSLLQRSQLKTHKLSSFLSCCTSLSPMFFFFFSPALSDSQTQTHPLMTRLLADFMQ